MIKYLVYLLLSFSTLSSLANKYKVTYTTSEDKSIVVEGTLVISQIKGDTVNIKLLSPAGSLMLLVAGVLNGDDHINITEDSRISGGYLYKHTGKLRGNIFKGKLVIIIRES